MASLISTHFLKPLSLGSVLAILPLAQSVAAVLPDIFDPGDVTTYHDTNNNGTFELGIDVPYSLGFDDFHTYPIYLLDKYFPAAGWDAAAGTGTLDVIVTTRSAGQTNSGGELAPYNIPDPITNPNISPVIDSWGNGGSSDTTMLVDNLYQYLFDTFQSSTPYFTFDQSETGSNPDLRLTALVQIINPADDSVVAHWSLDNLTNGIFDPTAYVTAAGQLCVPDGVALIANSNDCFSNNVGSGKFDYVIFAPTMNLANYVGNGYIFQGSWDFQDVDSGGEEITLTGRFSPTFAPVPAPGTLPLMSLVLILIALVQGSKHISTPLRSRSFFDQKIRSIPMGLLGN